MNKINNNDSVTVTTMGLVTEIKKTNLINHKPTIKRLDKNTYVIIDTGEVKEYDGYIKTEEKSRSNNKTSLSRTKLNNKALIIANYESAVTESLPDHHPDNPTCFLFRDPYRSAGNW